MPRSFVHTSQAAWQKDWHIRSNRRILLSREQVRSVAKWTQCISGHNNLGMISLVPCEPQGVLCVNCELDWYLNFTRIILRTSSWCVNLLPVGIRGVVYCHASLLPDQICLVTLLVPSAVHSSAVDNTSNLKTTRRRAIISHKYLIALLGTQRVAGFVWKSKWKLQRVESLT